ncbi:MAG: hypothetical protein J5768_00215 [Spirochaetales bacterium]|nr:hypothetical protein [Spirochaetales bacterium]MBO4423913.1 hypothetical protein [Spirochaetales bacterium]
MNTLKVTVSKSDKIPANIARCKRISLPRRLLRRLFGTSQEMIVLIPGSNIRNLDIRSEEDTDA